MNSIIIILPPVKPANRGEWPKNEPSNDSFVAPDDEPIPKEKWTPPPFSSGWRKCPRTPPVPPPGWGTYNPNSGPMTPRPLRSSYNNAEAYKKHIEAWAVKRGVYTPLRHEGFNPPQSHIVSEPSSPKKQKTPKVLSVNSSTPPSKHTRTTSPVSCEPVPGPRKTQKTLPPASGPSVSFEANIMDTKSSNHEDNNPADDLNRKNPKASHNATPKVSKEKNPIPQPLQLKGEPCETFAPQEDLIFIWDTTENLSAPKGSPNEEAKPENFQKPLDSDHEDNQSSHNSDTKDEDEIPPSHEYERGAFTSQSIDSCPELQKVSLKQVIPKSEVIFGLLALRNRFVGILQDLVWISAQRREELLRSFDSKCGEIMREPIIESLLTDLEGA
ncbi:hypothetical protein O181_008224 [Austropuccinia psidii MF-1]|uniref:Uncharacterized protein n=1 Tax=Austropuccinia psidii MF-1 TaxID=1389203 RepID=A0A9Q3BM94_9BASI|nr:hypothetical protein [Austropuccinia psidii MF-1]